MLSKAYDWYRIVNAKPSNEIIEKRRLAAADLIITIESPEKQELLISCAQAVVGGFELGFTKESKAVETVINSIRAKDGAFPSDLSENALELRVIAAIAIGELLAQGTRKPNEKTVKILASLIQSGFGLRPLPQGRFLRQMIQELLNTAKNVLAVAAQNARRSRDAVGALTVALKDLPDAPEQAIVSLGDAVEATVKTLTQQSNIDREEINILWWMFTGTSYSKGIPFVSMSAGVAALVCGAELGNMCIIPSGQNLVALVRQAFATGRKKTIANQTLETIVGEWDSSAQELLVPKEAVKIAEAYPVLFPLSWLAARLESSQNAPGWGSEFEKKTGLSTMTSYDHALIAVQALNERVAQRLCLSLNKEDVAGDDA